MKGTIDLHDEWGWGVLNEANEWLPLHPDDLTYFAEMKEKFDNFEARVLSSPEVEFETIIHPKFTGRIIYAKLNTKEEPKQESPEEPTMIDDWLNEYGDPEIYKKVERELELREAAEKYSLELLETKTIQHHEKTWIKSMFIHIAKGQAERMYSEEEVLNIQEKYNEYIQKNFNPEFSILPFKVFFEQFKKK